jgi:hypothetical protein
LSISLPRPPAPDHVFRHRRRRQHQRRGGAAARLGCGKSVVSRQLARVEADLGALVLEAVGPLMFHESSRLAGPVLCSTTT